MEQLSRDRILSIKRHLQDLDSPNRAPVDLILNYGIPHCGISMNDNHILLNSDLWSIYDLNERDPILSQKRGVYLKCTSLCRIFPIDAHQQGYFKIPLIYILHIYFGQTFLQTFQLIFSSII